MTLYSMKFVNQNNYLKQIFFYKSHKITIPVDHYIKISKEQNKKWRSAIKIYI